MLHVTVDALRYPAKQAPMLCPCFALWCRYLLGSIGASCDGRAMVCSAFAMCALAVEEWARSFGGSWKLSGGLVSEDALCAIDLTRDFWGRFDITEACAAYNDDCQTMVANTKSPSNLMSNRYYKPRLSNRDIALTLECHHTSNVQTFIPKPKQRLYDEDNLLEMATEDDTCPYHKTID
eukprot:1337951-Amphidinium_carterae.1